MNKTASVVSPLYESDSEDDIFSCFPPKKKALLSTDKKDKSHKNNKHAFKAQSFYGNSLSTSFPRKKKTCYGSVIKKRCASSIFTKDIKTQGTDCDGSSDSDYFSIPSKWDFNGPIGSDQEIDGLSPSISDVDISPKLVKSPRKNIHCESNENIEDALKKMTSVKDQLLRRRVRQKLPVMNTADNPINCDQLSDETSSKKRRSTTQSEIWINSLKLTMRDKKDLEDDDMLTDKHIFAGQKLMKMTFPNIDGMQDTCLSQTKFKPMLNEGLQIHHIDGNHWVLSSSIDGNITVYDTLNDDLSDDLKKHLRELYVHIFKNKSLTVEMSRVQIQRGYSDCGLFVIAMAYEIGMGNDPATIFFKQNQMRKHLMYCFEREELTPFPQKPKHIESVARVFEKVKLK